MRRFRNWERKYIPRLRSNDYYKMVKFILLAPFAIVIYYSHKLFQFISTKARFTRKDKPDIVLENIINGWVNLIIKNPVTEELAKKRAEICAGCPFAELSTGVYSVVVDNRTQNIRGAKCTKCGCPLSAKVRSSKDYCPIGKW